MYKSMERGVYEFLPPFDVYNSKKELVLASVRSIYEILDAGVNVYESIYKPVNLKQSDMAEDLQNNIKIDVFSDGNGGYLYIPSDKVKKRDNISSVKYVQKMIGINLGTLPADESLDSILTDIKVLIEAKLGITPVVRDACISLPIDINTNDHEAFMTAREAKKSDEGNYFIGLTECKKRNEELTTLVGRLDCVIKSKP